VFANELNSAKRPILENKFVVLLRLWSSRFVELRFNQERIVLVLTLALFISFCLTLNQFATAGNLSHCYRAWQFSACSASEWLS
jgi:hypothetical protein